ncbi:carbohydrate kinase [Pyrococcus sp. ST04]|uniref:carbohydrate kinase family protein n=1 Tax=Pyrococcus sp. ST04 TaxID=1183377 RepID=UPI0002605B7C|nr:carbohydrate kinase [Pyrococcus sp. ST04]AFK22864.1 putative Fructokinase [Pyrococcus sp. ST04]
MITAFGEVLIDFIATEEGELKRVKTFEKHPGGAPANVAVGVRRLGVNSALISKVGNDPFGDFLLEKLRAEGVNTEGVVVDKEKHTGVVFVQLKGAKPSFILYDGVAYFNLTPKDINWEILNASHIVHFGSVLLARRPSRETTIEVMERIQGYSLISFDVNLRPDLWKGQEEKLADTLRAVIELVDILKMSDEEEKILREMGIEAEGKLITAITLGKEGCILKSREDEVKVPGYPVKPVDTTGAGDAFTAALLVGVLAFREYLTWATLEKIGKFSNLIAGLSTLKRGAWSVPKREEIEKYREAREILKLLKF